MNPLQFFRGTDKHVLQPAWIPKRSVEAGSYRNTATVGLPEKA